MIFLTYWFVVFAPLFFAVYWAIPVATIRRITLLAGCAGFYLHFAGPAGVVAVVALGVLTYACGRLGGRLAPALAIVVCVATLVFYKYAVFLAESVVGAALPQWGGAAARDLHQFLPSAPPLAISFFVFEFVHYLMDVRRGSPPIRSPMSFALFGAFWPSLVAGPIKRYQQFIPELERGPAAVGHRDLAYGLLRVAIGLAKKFTADYLSQLILFWEPYFANVSPRTRWLLLLAIGLRILFDFSGYSDMAIGFARMMGIRLQENFRWPYLATSPIDFWRRWHISLSTWIRDYIYIPLGGGRHGLARKAVNGLVAFALCGLWHGAGWNFALWGLYHGIGLIATNAIELAAAAWMPREIRPTGRIALRLLGWAATLVFVMFGWLLFFYPLGRAVEMALLLVKRA
jgi:alginate O-acetyltransferase complex protein AlgI